MQSREKHWSWLFIGRYNHSHEWIPKSQSQTLISPLLTVRRTSLWKGKKMNKQTTRNKTYLKLTHGTASCQWFFSYYSIYYYKPNAYVTATTELQHKSKASPHSLWAITFSRPAWTGVIPWTSLSRVLKGEFRHVNESAPIKSSGGMQVGPNVPLLMKTAAKESS